MGNFLSQPKEFGIVARCMHYGLLQEGVEYGCVPDIARRLDTLQTDGIVLSFLRGIIIKALEERWYSAILSGGSTFVRNVISGQYSPTRHTNSIVGVFVRGGVFWDYCSETEYSEANMAQRGAVAIVEGVITPENYPSLKELREKVLCFGVDHVSIVGLFACNDEEFFRRHMCDFDTIVARDDVAAYLSLNTDRVSHAPTAILSAVHP